MIVYVLLFLLFLSFTIHVLALILYFLRKTANFFNSFIATTFSNILIGIILSIIAMKNPETIRGINVTILLWLVSGLIMSAMLLIQIYIMVSVVRRTRDPRLFHLNYFGKKVYEINVVKKSEIAAVALSMPFFLISGAYFVVMLISIIK